MSLFRACVAGSFAIVLTVNVVRAQTGAGNLPAGMSLTCKFNSGPRSGTTFDFSHTPGATPAPIGASCTDGAGSYGVSQPPGTTGGSSPGRGGNSGSGGGGLPPGMSLTCKFNSGPRSGQTFDFSHTPGATPAPIGASCTDGAGSYGVAQPPGTTGGSSPGRGGNSGSAGGSLPPGMSLTCKFNSGPRSGQTFDFSHTPGATPAPIGASCADGAGSYGVAQPPAAPTD